MPLTEDLVPCRPTAGGFKGVTQDIFEAFGQDAPLDVPPTTYVVNLKRPIAGATPGTARRSPPVGLQDALSGGH